MAFPKRNTAVLLRAFSSQKQLFIPHAVDIGVTDDRVLLLSKHSMFMPWLNFRDLAINYYSLDTNGTRLKCRLNPLGHKFTVTL